MRCRRPLSSAIALAALIAAGAVHAQPAEITHPELLDHGELDYPASELARRADVTVVVAALVERDGSVSQVDVVEPGGATFDEAAVAAVRAWRFAPARRGGKPVRARIQIPVHFTPPPLLPPVVTKAPPKAPPQPGTPPDDEHPEPPEVIITGHSRPPNLGASDIDIPLGELARVPRKSAAEQLTFAPGIFLTNEGGEGHAERVYLRGFDAREGQDIAFSVGGVPINESGNLHGNGFADLHFILPELVTRVRVVEGPFDPRQGNYAIAGSADWELGLIKRGLGAKYTVGSFNTHRLVALWGPAGQSVHTFGGVELYTTDGFGQNRDAKRATAMGQYEGRLGRSGFYRITAAAYATDYHSAGVLREDDLRAGRKGFYDTYDRGQGGSSLRFQLSGDVEARSGDTTFYQQVFAIRRDMRLRENFTGFLLDTQEARQTPHGQRGDRLDLANGVTTVGARGFARLAGELLNQKQELELGYFARGDLADASRQRIEAATGVPYKTDVALSSKLADLGLYGDAALRPTSWLTLRGGLRADLFAWDVLDACAVKSVSRPDHANPPGDASCLSQQRFGAYREPSQRSSTASIALLPRATLLVGPFRGFTLSASAGRGVRSMDPSYITQDVATPFASVVAWEGGATFAGGGERLAITARSIVFGTHVDRDLVFSETEGRNVIGGGTTRAGWAGAARVTGDFFDVNANVTLVKSTFDDTGLLVPYVPDVVARGDGALFHEIPFALAGHRPRGSLGLGVGFIGRRALPYGQRSDTIFTTDLSASLGWRWVEVGVSAQNLFDSQYRIAEYNFVSDFGSAPAPTLVPARHFVAGPPRTIFFTLSAAIGGS